MAEPPEKPVDDPAWIRTAPALTPVPVNILIFPDDDPLVPVAISNSPLATSSPGEVAISMLPDLPTDEVTPDFKKRLPPFDRSDRPPIIDKFPPCKGPAPASNRISPADEEEVPVITTTEPLFPEFELPDPIKIFPESP